MEGCGPKHLKFENASKSKQHDLSSSCQDLSRNPVVVQEDKSFLKVTLFCFKTIGFRIFVSQKDSLDRTSAGRR